ncbi:MAG: TonB-dependent receptor [Acidobacteriaceae bacterium]|nr:TonB-dependent receptor [Acidobacteriaceae bacterium]MBV8572969.1 TonB-dependent receptor [Acidobacteriaceae bacterium]
MKILRCTYCASVVLFAATASMYAQAVTGSVLGTVTDPSGAVVANAKVSLTNIGTGIVRNEQTNASGNYTFADIPEGNYTVTVEATGFKKDVRQSVNVLVNTSTRVDVQLQPGNISQQIEVTAAAPPLQTDRADTETSISTVATANLPVGTNRNFQSLLNLVPGTTRATFQHSTFFNASSSLQTEVNGQMRQGNNYQIEGIDDNERTGLLQILVPPIEAIATVDVSTSDFEAELGRASGAVTNVILKSGTNQLHGAAYEFVQNSEFNARSFFNAGVGHLTYNYFGGNIGGRIIKNKLFYFGDILRVTDHEASPNVFTIPTPAQISGNLSASPTAIYNPFTGNANGTGRQQFAGNVIPSTMINPISTKLLALLPAPNQPSATGVNNYYELLPFHKDTTSFDTKVDYDPTESDRIAVRLSYARPSIFQAPAFGSAGGAANGAFQGSGLQRTYSGGINYNRIFSPSLISEFRIGVAYYNNIATPSDYGQNQSEQLGIPGINLNQITSGLVGINIGSSGQFYSTPLLGYSASLPWTRAETNIDFANTWTKILGNHTIKWGGDLRRIRDALLQQQTFSPRGLYSFAAGQTALNSNGKQSATSYYNTMAAFLLDVPNQAGRDLPTYFPAIRAWEFFTFAQDKWVVTPKLTVDLGVRWEYYPPFTPQFAGGFSNYNPQNNTLVIAGVGGNPENLGRKTYYHYFAPRFGAAYRLTDKTVLRAGFGISYTPFPDNTYAFNYPVRANNAYNPLVTTYGPALLNNGQIATFQNGFPPPVFPAVPSSGIITNAPTNQSYIVIPLNYKNPYVESWNVAVEQSLPLGLVLDVAYVGNHGVDTSQVQYNLNAGFIPGAGTLGQPEFLAFHRTNATTEYFAPYSSMYNSLQVKLNRRFSNGFALTTSYTYGKGMGYQNDDDGGLDFYVNQRRNWARNDFDRTHTFVQSYVYDLPLGPGKRWLQSGVASSIVGGWRLNGVLTMMTGLPMTLTPSTNNLNMPGNTQTVNQISPVLVVKGVGPNSPWFSSQSFTAPTANGVFGNTGRNFLSGPGFFNLDASLFKVFAFRERYNIELRGEAFAITNTPQFANPGTTLGSPTFGYITSTIGGNSTASNGNRVLQLGVKLSF